MPRDTIGEKFALDDILDVAKPMEAAIIQGSSGRSPFFNPAKVLVTVSSPKVWLHWAYRVTFSLLVRFFTVRLGV